MRKARVRVFILAALVMAAAVIRLLWLQSIPLWWDEFVTLGRAKFALPDIWRSLSFQGPSDVALDSSPPLLHMLLHPVLAAGGASETWVKLPSVLFGVLTVLALYKLSTRLHGGRSGLFSAVLLAFSLYHVHYSREVRPYSLYLLLAVSSLWLLGCAMETNRIRDWFLYALAAIAALYASYLAGASLIAQGLFLAGLAVSRNMPKGRMLPAAISLAGVVLAYLPWLPGHIFQMELIYAPSGGMGLTWGFLWRAMGEFTTGSTLFLACSGLGLFVGFRRNAGGTFLVACWLLTPVAMALALRTAIAVNPRYLINFVPGLALLAGVCLDGLVEVLSTKLPGRVAALLGLSAAIWLSWPSLAGLPDYYRRDRHSVRDDLLDVARDAANADTMAFFRNRHLKVFARWYLPGVFGELIHSGDLRYRRVLLLCGQDFVPPGLGEPERHGDLDVYRVGLLNVSPLVASGTYRADFSNMNFYREAASWDNVGPDMFQKTLSLYDPQLPGRAVWRFIAPGGGFPDSVRLHGLLRLSHGPVARPPDAKVSIVAGNSLDSLKVLRTVSQADFTGEDLTVDLDIPRPDGAELDVGFSLDPGTVYGALEPVSLTLDFPGSSPAPGVTPEALRQRVDLRNWAPGPIPVGRTPCFAFDPTSAALADFQSRHPGLDPVARLPGLVVFDPFLADPWIDVPGAELGVAGKVEGMLVKGTMTGQTLTLGEAKAQLPLNAPPGSTLALSPGGQARLWTKLDFSRAEDKPFLQFNTTLAPGQPCLTCANENSCYATYSLASKAPVRAVRVVFTPEAYGEPGHEKFVRLSVSTDGARYKVFDSLTAKDSELWEGKHRHVAWVRLEKPSERVYLRFELSDNLARLWSGPEYPLRIDAWLDPAARMPLDLAGRTFSPASDGAPVRVYLSPVPLPDLDNLLAPH